MLPMNTAEGLLAHYQHITGVDYVFGTLDRKPSLEECLALHVKYFESHHKPSVPHGQALFVDLRPAFRKPLDDVTPKFHVIAAIPKDATPPQT
jgi:hypothetical protein